MPLQLTEGLVDELMTFFKERLPDKLAVLNREYEDGVKLEAPGESAYYVGEKTLRDGLANYPAVFVFGTDMTVGRYGPQFVDAEHTVEITVALKGLDTELLQRGMYRYARAMWELIADRFFGLADRSNYFTTGEPRVEYERPPSMEASGEVVARMHLYASFNRQEEVA